MLLLLLYDQCQIDLSIHISDLIIIKNEMTYHYHEVHILLTLKHWEMYGCIVRTVATDAPVLKHQAINIHNAD